MGRYAIIKLLLIFPSLILLSLVVFFMTRIAPGDPVTSLVELRGQAVRELNTSEISKEYLDIARELNLDKPVFYFSILPHYYPDTLHRIVHAEKKRVLKTWLHKNRNWPAIQKFNDEIKEFRSVTLEIPESTLPPKIKNDMLIELKRMEGATSPESLSAIESELNEKLKELNPDSSAILESSFSKLQNALTHLSTERKNIFGFFPKLRFHGFQNQYHLWVSKLIVFDFGNSVIDSRPVLDKIGSAIGWTLFYVLIAYVFSLLVAIPLGVYNAWNHGKLVERIISSLSFIFYAFPLFWIATLAVIFLTNGLYAPWLHIFPGIGIGNIDSDMNFFEKTGQAFPFLILPALLLALHSAASGIRIVRNSAFSELKADYFITAKAKGLTNRRILWNHILPNAMLPVITLLVSSFPAALAGSVVLEVLFNIPGMGRLLYDSILFMDWSVVFGILIIMGLLTFIFYLIGDLLYAFLNPKIKYGMQ